MNKDPQYIDLNVNVRQNKNNGQISLSLSKRQFKKKLKDLGLGSQSIIKVPKTLPIRIPWSSE